MSASRANNLRELEQELQQALVEDNGPLQPEASEPQPEAPNAPMEDPVEKRAFDAFGLTAAEREDVRAWERGGPPPTTPRALEYMSIALEVEDSV